MKIAVPMTEDGIFSLHFGHCDMVALYDIDESQKTILNKTVLPAPPHEPGLFPKWVTEQGAQCILAGGMGARAQGLFKEYNIRVLIGVDGSDPDTIINDFLNGTLKTGLNVCDH